MIRTLLITIARNAYGGAYEISTFFFTFTLALLATFLLYKLGSETTFYLSYSICDFASCLLLFDFESYFIHFCMGLIEHQSLILAPLWSISPSLSHTHTQCKCYSLCVIVISCGLIWSLCVSFYFYFIPYSTCIAWAVVLLLCIFYIFFFG
jgi:hypothetical protein